MAQLAVAGLTSLGVGATAANLIVGIGFTVIGQALQQRKSGEQFSQPEQRTTGSQVPQSFVLGRRQIQGHDMAPWYSHSDQRYRVYIIHLSSFPVTGLDAISVDGTRIAMSDMGGDHAYGVTPTSGDYKDKVWVRFHDGNQTVADPYLVDRFSDHPERPWSTDHIALGNAYVVVTCYGDRDVFSGEPKLAFEVLGIPVYDRRTGETGYSGNSVVLLENILRDVGWGDERWGLKMTSARLPHSQWVTAMNADIAQHEVGYEVFMRSTSGGQRPLDVVDELQVAANARIADFMGDWHIKVGVSALPVMAISATDYLRDLSDSYSPIGSVSESYNAIRLTCTIPANDWESKTLAIRYAPDRDPDEPVNVGDVSGTAILSRQHGGKVARFLARDALRRRLINVPLAEAPELFEAAAVSDEVRGWDAKLFEAAQLVYLGGAWMMQGREIDPTDNGWATPDDLDAADASGELVVLQRRLLDLNALADLSSQGNPIVRLSWDGEAVPYRDVALQFRMAGTTDLIVDETYTAQNGGTVVRHLRGGVEYEYRARGLRRRTAWNGWHTITTSAGGIGLDDLGPDAQAIIDRHDATIATNAAALSQAQLEFLGIALDIAAGDSTAAAHTLLVAQEVGDTDARVSQEIIARADGDTALAGRLDIVEASVGDNYASFQEFVTAYTTQYQAVVGDVTTLTASFNGLEAEVETNATALATIEGYLAATYAIRVSAGGASAGFEIVAADDPINGPQSTIRFDADYIIADGTILYAHIGEAQVDTLTIAGNAVTVPKVQERTTVLTGDGGWQEAHSTTITLTQAGVLLFFWNGQQAYQTQESPGLGMRLFVNGVQEFYRLTDNGNSGIRTDQISFIASKNVSAGTHTVVMEWFGGTTAVTLRQRALVIIGAMR